MFGSNHEFMYFELRLPDIFHSLLILSIREGQLFLFDLVDGLTVPGSSIFRFIVETKGVILKLEG